MPVLTDGTITLEGTADGTLQVLQIDELREFDETEVLDLPDDAVRMAGNTEQVILALLKAADIEVPNIKATASTDPQGDARQDQLKKIAGHCLWIDLLSLEVTNLDDQGWKIKRDYHSERKNWFIMLYLGLDKNLKKVTDPTLDVETPEPSVTGGLRFVGVR